MKRAAIASQTKTEPGCKGVLTAARGAASVGMRRLSSPPPLSGPKAGLLLVLTALFIGSTALFPAPARALSAQELFREAEGKVLVLEVLDDKGKKLAAHTALFLDGERAVTQCDLLKGGASLMLRHENEVYPAKPLHKDGARNLCTLEVSGASKGVALRDVDPEAGARVYAVSNALGLGISISEGVVSGIREARGDTVLQFTAPIAPGSEGGGLFDEEGRLVGIINYQQRDGQNVNFALPARFIRQIEQRAASIDAAESWRGKADELARQGKWQELAESAGQWVEALPDSLEARMALIGARRQLKEWDAAEKSCRDLLKLDPTSSWAGVELSALLVLQGKYQEAIEAARALLAQRREDATIWLLIGYAEEGLGHAPEAKDAMAKAVQLEPWNWQALQGLVTLGRRHNDWNLAIAAQSRLVQFEPGNLTARLKLVDLLLAGGRVQRALNNVEKALELAPGDGDAWLFKGAVLSRLGRYGEAREALSKGLGLKPARSALGWVWLGDLYEEVKLYPEAIEAYREALRLSPEDQAVRGRLGVVLKDGLRLQEALALFEKLQAEAPADPFAVRQLCYVRGYLGQADQAIPACELSLKLEARQPKVWAALMEEYHQAGRMDDARRAYRKLQTLDQGWADHAYQRVLLPYEVRP